MSCWIAPRAGPYTGLAPKNETQHQTDPERSKDRFRRVLADVLLAFGLKSADTMARIIPYPFRAAQIFIGHCARGRAEIFRRFCRRASHHALLFLPPAAERQRLDPFGFRQPYFSLIDDLFKLSVPMLH
jgi:hypothetical protein